MLLAPLDLLTKEKSELSDKLNRLLASQYTVTVENHELCSARPDVHKQCKGSKYALAERLLSCSQRAQVLENETKSLIIRMPGSQ